MALRRKTGGRTKGTPNRATKALRDMILGALDDAGGQAYLVQCARVQPRAFLALLGRILPTQVESSVSEGPAVVDWRALLLNAPASVERIDAATPRELIDLEAEASPLAARRPSRERP